MEQSSINWPLMETKKKGKKISADNHVREAIVGLPLMRCLCTLDM